MLKGFFYIDSSYSNDETKAILVYINHDNHVRIMLPNDDYEGYCFAQYQEECTDAVANYLDQFDGDSLTEDQIVQILNNINSIG